MIDYEITAEMIEKVKAVPACKKAIKWLEQKTRTWQELKERRVYWAVWAMVKMPDCPLDLEGLDDDDRDWVLSERGMEESE